MNDFESLKVSVLVAADFPLLRRGIVAVLRGEPWVKLCEETGEAKVACDLCLRHQPSLAVVDLELEKGDGLTLVRELAHLRPGLGIMALSVRNEQAWVQRAFLTGAGGFLSKQDAAHELPAGLWRMQQGERYLGRRILAMMEADLTLKKTQAVALNTLSNREMEVLRRVGTGEGPVAIAQALSIAVTTVETHFHRIKRKLALSNGKELRRLASQWR